MIRRVVAPLALAALSGAAADAYQTATPAAKPAEIKPAEVKSAQAQPPARAAAPTAANAIARLALTDLRLVEAPSEDDYRIADILLSLAHDQAPGNVELIRRRIEASWNAGRSEDSLALTRKLIALDPSDTVAQLRLISATIGRKQTARERLELYARFVGSDKIDASVRSRLAVDACLLARELGEDAKFREYLRVSTVLDSSNKEAAVLAVSTYAQDHPGDPVGLIELYSNLLMADPLDPLAYLSLADLLAHQGVFDQANRLHALGRDLLRKTDGEITQTTEVEALVLEWQVDGPAKVNKRISNALESQRNAVRAYNQSVRDAGIGLGQDLGEPEDVRLGPDTEKVRLATAIAAEDKAGAEASLKDLTASAAYKRKIATDDRERPPGLTREQALAQADASLLDLQFWRVLAGLDVDKVDADLAAIKAEVDDGSPGPEIVRAILLLRQNKPGEALESLDKIIAGLPEEKLVRATCEYARGLALEALGRKDDCLASMRFVQTAFPTRPVGAMSRFKIEKMIGGRDQFSPHRADVTRIAEGIPKWVDEMIAQPKTFMSLAADAPLREEFGDLTPVTITLRNISPIPLGLGSDKPLNSQFMLTSVLGGTASRLSPLVRPEIVELDRRLRLAPLESLKVTVYPGLGYAGMAIDFGCASQARINWKVIQGYRPAKNGNFIPGPLSLTVETSTVTRTGLAESRMSIEEAAKFIASADDQNFSRVLVVAIERLWREGVNADLDHAAEERRKAVVAKTPAGTSAPTEPPLTPLPAGSPGSPTIIPPTPAAVAPTAPVLASVDFAAERRAVVEALVTIYPRLSAPARAAIAAAIPHAGQIAEAQPLDVLILRDEDPLIRPIAFVSRIKQGDDPRLEPASKGQDPRLAELAQLLTARLMRTGPSYARLKGGLSALRGDSGAAGE